MPRPKKQHLKQRSDGRYACRYKDKWFMGLTEDEALQAREEYKRQEIRGELKPAPTVPTVAQYVLTWLPLYKKGVSEKCYNDYAKQLDALAAVIGPIPLNAVTVDQAAGVWTHYRNYSASTIKRARQLYTALYETAIENDYCVKNPFKAKSNVPPRGSAGTHRDLSELEKALVRSTPHRFQLAAMIMLYAGLRRGEVLAMTADDIDLSRNVLTVSRAVRFSGNKPLIVDPKTEAGRREIPILSPLRPLLVRFKEANKKTQSDDPPALVCPSARGQLMTETAFSRAWDSYITAISAAAGMRITIRPHDFRHTYCTMLFESGAVDLHQAMIWMGHADEKMILHIYDHVNTHRTQTAAARLDAALQPSAAAIVGKTVGSDFLKFQIFCEISKNPRTPASLRL